jgi:hypothetical protein
LPDLVRSNANDERGETLAEDVDRLCDCC